MRRKRKQRSKKGARKGIYILPNLFTSASMFGGFYAIVAAIQGRFEAAAIAIFVSAVFDGLDGRVARFTNTASNFGTEYDSLSDLVAFGVAPGVLAFLWALEPFGRLGWLAAFMFVICGALRLARFNVEKSKVKGHHFKGLPIPAAACFIASAVLFASETNGLMGTKHIIIIAMIYVLSFLMVSTIRYLSPKEFHLRNQKPFQALVWIILICIVIAYKPKVLLFLIMLSYVFSGPAVSIYRLFGRRILTERLGHRIPVFEDGEDLNMLKDKEVF